MTTTTTTTPAEPTSAESPCCSKWAWIGLALFTLLCFAVDAYQLRVLEFSNGGENAVVESVLELRRGDGSWGSWLTPTLHDELRTKKPPLATWLSAIGARPATVAKLSDPDPVIRNDAFESLAWQVRLPSLIAMCGVLVATFVLGSLAGGHRLGLVSAIVCGTSLFWLRNARLATTDVHLALWVSVANCFLAVAIFRRRWWLGFVGAGIALGLAMMSKGPVALVQTVVPVLAFAVWSRWRLPRVRLEEPELAARRRFVGPLLVGVGVFVIVGFAWYGFVLWNNPNVLAEWRSEVTREGATDMEPSRWYNYVLLLIHVMPWTFFLVAGLIGAGTLVGKRWAADEPRGMRHIVLPLMLLMIPVLVMSFFRDREIRYLIPLLSPAAVVAGWAAVELLAPAEGPRWRGWLVGLFHWLPLLGVGAGLLMFASPIGVIKTREGTPWYTMPQAIVGATVAVGLVIASLIAQRRYRLWAVLIGTAAVMLPWYVVMNAGYRFYKDGRSEMRPLAEEILASPNPQAKVYSFRADRPIRRAPIDLAVYLNRTVQNVRTPEELAGTTGPRFYMVREKVKDRAAVDPMSFAPSAGGPWHYFSETRTNSAIWFVYFADAN